MSVPIFVNGKDYYNRDEALAAWFEEWLMKQDFEQDLINAKNEQEYRKNNPDWNIPTVMYGIRKKHTCIKKQEIAVFYDRTPWCKRARTAETHWYKVLYKRKATPKEAEDIKSSTRRYKIFSYYIEKRMTLDKALSIIIDDDRILGIDNATVVEVVKAFETFFNRKFRIYKPECTTQLNLFAK